MSALDGKTPTTDTINYSILYQDIPTLSASAGFLTSFLGKRVISTANQLAPANGAPTYQTIFAITDSARVQLVPMAYANYRIGGYKSIPWGRTHESELATEFNLSAGFGVNPNSGTPQPEFFLGTAIGVNHLMIHLGVHWGRTENLGGGFVLNSVVPSMFAGSVPLNWSYHAAFSIGFSVRVAPY